MKRIFAIIVVLLSLICADQAHAQLVSGGILGGGGGAATFIGLNPPTTPIVGQLWFNVNDLQTYIYYDDGTSKQWVPVINITGGGAGGGGGGSVPPGSTIDSPIFTTSVTGPDGGTWTSTGITLPSSSEFTGGSFDIAGGGTWNSSGMTVPGSTNITNLSVTGVVSLPAGSITDTMLANGYSGIGTCTAGQFVNKLNRNAAPTCAAPPAAGAPLTNPPGGAGNYAPISNPNFSGTLELGGVAFGGACSAGAAVTAISNGVVPTCTAFASSNNTILTGTTSIANLAVSSTSTFNGGATFNSTTNFVGGLTMPDGSTWTSTALTVNSPTTFNSTTTFAGKMTFPDGSYYDTNGHEVMKNLGVGVVAYTDGANPGGGGLVSGSSLVVNKSGWGSTTDLHGYWDSTGIENLYGIFAATFYSPVGRTTTDPDGPNMPEVAVETDPNNAALQNPFGEYFFQNRSTPRPSEDPTWQAEGLQAMNGLGIHDNTWDAQYGCTSDGATFWLGSCAIMAVSDINYNNILYKSEVANNGSGTASAAAYELTNNAPHIGGLYLQGTGFTPNPGQQPDQLLLYTNAPNGIAANPAITLSQLSRGSTLLFGSFTRPVAALTPVTGGGIYISAGAHNATDGSGNWIADATTATIQTQENGGAQGIYYNTGLTVGSPYSPTEIGYWGGTGLSIKVGQLASFASPSTNPTINSENETLTIPNGGSAPLPVCAGLLVLNDRMVNGAVCLYMYGHGTVNLVNQVGGWCVANSTSPAAGTMSVAFDGTTFRVYNNMGGQTVLGIFNVCTRTYAN